MHPERPAGGRSTNRLIIGLAVAAVAVAISAPFVVDQGTASASELDRFTSCDDLETFLGDAAATQAEVFGSAEVTDQRLADGDVATSTAGAAEEATAAPAAGAAQDGAASSQQSAGTGSTNVQVAGVDELDVVDGDGERLLVTSGDGRIDLVDVAAGTVVDSLTVAGYGQQLTWDVERGVAWVVSSAESVDDAGLYLPQVEVTRVAVGEGLEAAGTWSVTGYLVGARRIEDRLHLVASDGGSVVHGFVGDVVGSESGGAPPSEPTVTVPFTDGDGTPVVPCDQVWHPPTPSEPTATLVATLEVGEGTGELAPVATAEIVGGGGLVHANAGALYVATPQWLDDGTSETSIHRFTLDELAWTGSGRVPGTVMGQFALDESGGVLRVATTVEGTFGGGPITIEPGIGDGEPITTEPGPDGDEPIPMPMPVEPADVDNLVVTLDTEGDLDELGRLAGLGHPGERIQGIRFAGDVAYVVTFLRTDPLYVIDLSDPAAPMATGELEIPGFSSYLHPVGDGRVVGIGMAGTDDGTLTGAQAQLFDVGDPTAPAVLDAEPLGDESEAGTEHRAFTDLGGGRFAVPALEYPDFPGEIVPLPRPVEGDEPISIDPTSPEVYAPRLEVVVLDSAGDGLTVARRLDVTAAAGADAPTIGYGTRTVPVGDALAVVTAGVGIAVFDGGAGTGTWIDLVP
ncbi:MAG: beta-propeller domain-containing protein [Acidimicrobiales bacterium]